MIINSMFGLFSGLKDGQLFFKCFFEIGDCVFCEAFHEVY